MSEMELGNLRSILDEHEQFARGLRVVDPGYDVAQQILGLIADAREGLRPSADSTANFLQNRDIIEQLAMLRQQAEALIKGKHA
ncbi:MAG: hypothetical protein OEV84_07590 [Betaproteobacteria bacterium]|jgi:hypothetical protein|nr:hypothetical protein [Betaproteobacteria bacterium]